jgi:hypothetical protein
VVSVHLRNPGVAVRCRSKDNSRKAIRAVQYVRPECGCRRAASRAKIIGGLCVTLAIIHLVVGAAGAVSDTWVEQVALSRDRCRSHAL